LKDLEKAAATKSTENDPQAVRLPLKLQQLVEQACTDNCVTVPVWFVVQEAIKAEIDDWGDHENEWADRMRELWRDAPKEGKC
jgi:hypothetical protein